jgi:alpha-beta hydrolase superfamily lysophospholipase
MRNSDWDASYLRRASFPDSSRRDISDRPPVRMLIIGHSFGAQLVFSSIAENLVETMSSQPSDPGARIMRYGDMVILINPAFEATRVLPLLRMEPPGGDENTVISQNGAVPPFVP